MGRRRLGSQTNTLYVKASNTPTLWRIAKRDAPSEPVDFDYAADLGGSSIEVRTGTVGRTRASATDQKAALRNADGDRHDDRQLPAGRPDRRFTRSARTSRASRRDASTDAGCVRDTGRDGDAGGLVFLSGGSSTFFAVDTRDGTIRWLRARASGRTRIPGHRPSRYTQFLVIATGSGEGATLQAFSLGQGGRSQIIRRASS